MARNGFYRRTSFGYDPTVLQLPTNDVSLPAGTQVPDAQGNIGTVQPDGSIIYPRPFASEISYLLGIGSGPHDPNYHLYQAGAVGILGFAGWKLYKHFRRYRHGVR